MKEKRTQMSSLLDPSNEGHLRFARKWPLVEAAGIEPVSRKSEAQPAEQLALRPDLDLAQTLAHETEKRPQTDPDLARRIDAWPTLAPTVKRMILAALEGSEP